MSTHSRQVRCAIYTRKSSDEGLEQSFNSLDAQREACAAYILSQASEGWSQVPDRYDDGGLSGGTLERAALQRLLADVRDSRIDIIVVYKVDRLTRSLLDFAKLVEAFDAAGTSFVSVTQSFNTTTSMGRLTLNMLLSFAQFEREVTAERIRDKIAASKAKGMWMGGIPPLGYKPDGRTLAIVEEHAALVRLVFERYLSFGNVRLLAASLETEGIISPQRVLTTGKVISGVPFSRGQLYLLLNNRIYLGEVWHKEQMYPGLHPGIIERDLFAAVQAMLATNRQGERGPNRAKRSSLLAGLVRDEAGKPLIATHASVGKQHYRYYISQALNQGTSETGIRVPAREIETVVVKRIAALFDDPVELVATAWLQVAAEDYAEVAARAKEVAARVEQRDHATTRALVSAVTVERGRIVVEVQGGAIASALGAQQSDGAPATLTLATDVRLTRSGRAMRLVHGDGIAAGENTNAQLIRLVAKAHRYWRDLKRGQLGIPELAQAEGVSPPYYSRVLKLAFLSPTVVDAILAGKQAACVDIGLITAPDAIQQDWKAQANGYLPSRG